MKKVTNAQRKENLKKVTPLVQYLKDNHISQSEVAFKTGLHLGTVNRIIHGWQPLLPNTLQKIADALGVEYYILNGENVTTRVLNLEEVCGFLEYKGVITKMRSVYDVRCWLKGIEEDSAADEQEPKIVIRSNMLDNVGNTKQSQVQQPQQYDIQCSNEGFVYFYHNVPFSNFWKCEPIEYDSHTFNCSEAIFMYQKALLFGDKEYALKIVETDNSTSFKSQDERCKAVKKLGRKVRGFVQETWDAECYKCMYNALEAKAKYDSEFRRLLLLPEFAEKTFVEATRLDKIWGIGISIKKAMEVGRAGWKGTNLLGKALTELRDNLNLDLSVKMK